MKKILLVALLVLLPLSVYALEPMADGGLDEITAQEGVRITIGGQTQADALTIEQEATSTSWTNTSGDVETGIYMKVDQAGPDTIKIWGDLTIVAAEFDIDENPATDLVSAVQISLPHIYKTSGAKKTDIFIASRAVPATTTMCEPTEGKLGSQYRSGGYTEITGGTIYISAIE